MLWKTPQYKSGLPLKSSGTNSVGTAFSRPNRDSVNMALERYLPLYSSPTLINAMDKETRLDKSRSVQSAVMMIRSEYGACLTAKRFER